MDTLERLFEGVGMADTDGLDPTDDMPHPRDMAVAEAAGKGGSLATTDASGDAEAMSDEDYRSALAAGISAAENYVDQELSPDRETATDYYNAEPFGDEEEGKSDVVMSEVRDSVLALMPDLLRVFCGSTDPVEFVGSEGVDPDVAEQQTQYINHIAMVDNPGFRILYNAFKDGLVRRAGIVTWWFEEKQIVTQSDFSDLPPAAFAMLQSEAQDQSDNSVNTVYNVQITGQRPDVDETGAPIQLTSGRLVRHFTQKRFRWRALPPEEFIFTPATSDEIEDWDLVGTRTVSTVSKLIEDGHDEEKIREAMEAAGVNAGSYSSLEMNPERMSRNQAASERIFDTGFNSVDPASKELKVCTIYPLIDKDGDGIAERRKVVTIGDNAYPIYDEIYGTDRLLPFAIFCPDPEPHTPIGQSMADQTMDLQYIKSQVVRRTLDSLDQSINSRMVVVEGQTNLDDALNMENGALIRVKSPGAVQQLQTAFQGQAAMPVLAYMDQVRTRRTGQTMGPAGLDADVLQSTTKSAADAVVDNSQARAEMIARVFAETALARVFRGLLQLVCEHQDYKRVLRMRGKATEIDPRSWNSDVELMVNVGTGRGKQSQRIQSLMTIAGMQKEIIEKYGPGNPMVGLNHISYTATQIVKEMGYADASKFFNSIDAAAAKNIADQVAAQPKKPTPEELLLQAQREKIANDRQNVIDKLDLEKLKALLEDDRVRDKNAMDYTVQSATAVAEYGATMDDMALQREMADHKSSDDMAKHALQLGLSDIAGAPGAAPAAPQAPTPGPMAPNGPMQ